MLTAVQGIIKGNSVIIENENISIHDGKHAIVTILDVPVDEDNEISKRELYLDKKRNMK